MKFLILGASGMLGNAILRELSATDDFDVVGTVRSEHSKTLLPDPVRNKVMVGVDIENTDALIKLMSDVRPDVVVNCIGLVKQLAEANDPLISLPINALFPHKLARICELASARLIHMSTDCVFSGNKGMYIESDYADAKDLYGRSKYLGEVDYQNAITLRTSIIGHELSGARSLIDWFLAQQGTVRGFTKAIFSGLPTVEIARLIRDHVVPDTQLRGVYHVSSEPIDKYNLLKLVSSEYNKEIEITPDESVLIDRSLNSDRFRNATGFYPKPWPELIASMKSFG